MSTPDRPEIHPLIRDRWSPRAFTDRSIEPPTLASLLEAARWAASSFNEQPWRFLIARREDREGFERILSCLSEKNRVWAQHAAVLGLVAVKTTFTRNDQPNRFAHHDAGAALAQLTLQATALGLAVHQMAGYSVDAARERLGIPDGFEPDAAFAIGEPGAVERLPDDLREREEAPRSRRAPREIFFGATWDRAFDLP